MRTLTHRLLGHRIGTRWAWAALSAAGALLATLAWATPAAAAADRHASPHGSGNTCTEVAPCSLEVAIGGAPEGARVLVHGETGFYAPSSSITTTKAISVIGIGGSPMIAFSAGGLSLAGGSIKNVTIQGHGPAPALTLKGGADGSQLDIRAYGTGHACAALRGTVLKNVLCMVDGAGGRALEVKGAVTLRNVTLFGGTEAALSVVGSASCRCERFTVTIVNSIIWAPSSTDIAITTKAPDVTVKPTHSNFRTVSKAAGGGDIRVVSSTTNQTKAGKRPIFIAAANLRAAKGSPVINAGTDASASGPRDLDSRPRKAGGRTDIGAYEYSPPDTTITSGPSGMVTDGIEVMFAFSASRPGSHFSCRSDAREWVACSSPWSPWYPGYGAGTHTFSVQARDRLGYVDPTPASRTYTEAAP